MTVHLSTLDNGLRVATDTVATVETVSLGAWVGVGTRNEPAEINGVAHLLEHMAFKGTERRSAYDIAEEIEAVGGHLNAYTGRESTAYYAKVLAEHAPLALDIIADILQNPTFDEEELQRERAVVLQEIGQSNDTPDDSVFDRFQEIAYPGQALGRPVLGTSEIVSGIDRAALRRYMRRHYGASTMVMVAAGNIEHDRIVALVGDDFVLCRARRRSGSNRPASGAATIGRAGISSRSTFCWGWNRSAIWSPIIIPLRSCRPCSAAACRRDSSRRFGKSAAWCIRSIPTFRPIATGGCSASMPGPGRRKSAS